MEQPPAPHHTPRPRPTTRTGKAGRSARGKQRVARRYQAVIEMAPDATVVADDTGRIRLVNRQTEVLFGAVREDLLGQPVELLIPERFHSAHLRHRADYATAPRTRSMGAHLHLYGRRLDGSEFPVEVSLAPLQEDSTSFVIASIRDVTEVQRVQAANQELRRLLVLTDTALAHLGLDALLPELLHRVVDAMAVDNAAILLLDEAGQELRICAARGLEESVADEVRVPLGQGFAGRIAASREPLIVGDLSSFPVANAFLHEQLRSIVGVPLLLRERVLGVVHIGTSDPHQFTTQDVQLLQRVADRITVAIERAQLFEMERRTRAEAEAARAAAQQQTEQLDRIFEQMTDALVVYDAEGRLVRANAALQRLVGLDAAPPGYSDTGLSERMGPYIVRDEHGRPLAPEDTPSVRALHGDVVTGSEAMDLRLRTFHGREVEVNASAAPLLDHTGHIIGTIGILRDQTERKRLAREREEALRRSEEWFRSMANTAPVLLWVAGVDGQLTFVNDTWLRFTGRTLEQELGNGWAEGIHPDDQKRCLHIYLTAFQHQQPFTVEYRLRRFDGAYRWLVCNGVPRVAPDGSFLGYIGSDVDISERKHLEQEREEARTTAERQAEELNRIVEALGDALIVYDAQGRLTHMNAATRSMLGLDAASPDYFQLSLAERNALFERRDEAGHLLAPEDLPMARALRGEILTGSHAVASRMRTLDGRDVETITSAAPLRNRDGHIVGAVGILRDVTKLNQLGRERTEQAAQLDRIFESIADGLIVVDAQGHVVRMNPAAKHMFDIEQLPPAYSVFGPPTAGKGRYVVHDLQGRLLDEREWWLQRLQRDAGVTERSVQEVQVQTVDGRTLDLTATVAPLHDAVGHLLGAVSVLHDSTERNRLLREREQARVNELSAREVARQLDQFFAIASHDIRGPVTALGGFVQLARMRAEALEAALAARGVHDTALVAHLVKALATADESSERLMRLVTRLFDVARARSGTLTRTLAPCDLVKLMREQVAAQQSATPGRMVQLEVPHRPVVVLADADRLGQVLMNYLANAVKYSADDQPIAVRLRLTEGKALVAVQDHGPGLPAAEQQRVWEPSYRAPGVEAQSSTSAASGSLGMGLYVCKSIVELHPGGQVGVESVVGRGSTFWFQLPLAAAPHEAV